MHQIQEKYLFFDITVNNSTAKSFNCNIDYPTFFCFANSKEEAIGKMMLSDFPYKKKEIVRIDQY